MGKQSRRKREAREAAATVADRSEVEMTCTHCGQPTTGARIEFARGCPTCGHDNFQIGEPQFFGDWADR